MGSSDTIADPDNGTNTVLPINRPSIWVLTGKEPQRRCNASPAPTLPSTVPKRLQRVPPDGVNAGGGAFEAPAVMEVSPGATSS